MAVIDSGANVYHNDLWYSVAACYNGATEQQGFSYVKDKRGHGSMTAGILAATGNNKIAAAGVANGADLYVVKAEDDDGRQYISYEINGIYWAVSKGCRVISISMSSTDYSAAEEKAIQYAYNNGAVVVCSGGNTGVNEYRYPACYDGVVAVSALKYSASSGYSISTSSTYNNKIDIAGPATSLYGVSNTDYTELKAGGATSAATPYVAGVAAMIFQADPSLTAKECVDILTSTATDAGAKGYDVRYGYGKINPLAAVQKAVYKKSSISRTITGVPKSASKTLATKSFRLSPKTSGSGTFSYKSGNTKVAKVSGSTVKICGIGKTTITVSIAQSGIFRPASAKLVLTVTPKKVSAKAAKGGKKQLTAKWKKLSGVTGYQIVTAKNSSFTKKKKAVTVSSGKTISKTVKKLSKGTWYVKVRAYKKVGGKKIYGPYSSVKKTKVK